jgi:hypothetical protein
MLDICRTDKFGRALLRLLLVDHQVIEGKDIVDVANSTAVIRIDELDHGKTPFG